MKKVILLILYRIKTGLEQLSQDIQIIKNELTFHLYNGQCVRDVYTLYLENYNAKCKSYDTIKRKFEVVQEPVKIKIVTTGFTEPELIVFNTYIEAIESGMKVVESTLKRYDACLKIYRDNT